MKTYLSWAMILVVGILVVVSCSTKKAAAADLGTAMGIATANFPAGADAAGMGNTDAAALNYSSNNPASVGYKDPAAQKMHGASTSFGVASFKNGPTIKAGSVNGLVELPWAIVQVSYDYYHSNRKETVAGSEDKFSNSPSGTLSVGKLISENSIIDGDKLYVGASIGFGKSRFTMLDPTSGTMSLENKGRSTTAAAGLIYQPTEQLAIGAYWERSWNRDRSTERWIDEETGGTVEDNFRSRSKSDKLRVGASYQITESTRLAVDVQHLNIDHYKKTQIMAGIEQCIANGVCVYGGWSGSGPTAGLGIELGSVYVGLSYMHNPFPDLKEHYGKNRVVMGTVSIALGGKVKKELAEDVKEELEAAKKIADSQN